MPANATARESMGMLKTDDTALILIDVQGNLAEAMHAKKALYENLRKLIKGVQVLKIPIIWLEQVPEKLGPTIPQVSELLPSIRPIPKSSFSCSRNRTFTESLDRLDRRQLLLTGIESHVCVYQTAVDLLEEGYEVHVVADAVSSRTPENKQIGLDKTKDAGCRITSTETALFELLGVAEGPEFKEIAKIVK